MKRILVLLIIAGVALVLPNHSNAQGYYSSYTYSYNNYNDWELPHHVRNIVVDYYGGCGIVNARSYYVNGHLSYNLFLRTGHGYVEIEVDRFGYITRRINYTSFPTHHVWVNNHSVYFKNKHYYVHNSHYYDHNNHGHTTHSYYIDYSKSNHHKSDKNTHSQNKNNGYLKGQTNTNRNGDVQIRQRYDSRINNDNKRISKDVQNSRYDRNIENVAYNTRRGK